MTIVATLAGLIAGAALVFVLLRPAVRERLTLRADLETARAAMVVATTEAAATKATLVALEQNLPDNVRRISAETLDASREAFLAQAGERVEKTILPLQERLLALKKLVDDTESQRKEEGGRLQEQLASLAEGNRSLAVALGSTHTRGRWGEAQLERVLEFVGMDEGRDFTRQQTGAGGRPDIVVHLPGGKNVVIDAKAPFDAFDRADAATTPEERNTALAEFARRVREHVTALGRKGYFAHVQPSPDFVFMFLPGDAYLDAAEEHDRELFAYAYERGVLIATPRTIVVMLRTIRVAWQNESASEDARQIQALGTELLGRFQKFVEHMEKIGRGLGSANAAYQDAVGSYNRRLLPQARKLATLAPAQTTPYELHADAPLDGADETHELGPADVDVIDADAGEDSDTP